MGEPYSQSQPRHSDAKRSRPPKNDLQGKRVPAGWLNRALSRLPRPAILIAWGVSVLALFGLAVYIGALNGYQTAVQARQEQKDLAQIRAIVEQYQLGLQDQQAGRLEVAKQRYEWVLSQDPNFPEADQRLADVNAILYATATPTATPLPTPTPTLTPTPDLRPIQELFDTAASFLSASDWDGVINAVINLRSVDPSYKVAQVDRMLYIALRNRGVNKILQDGDLGGGTYDLTLAARFGPLDAEANYVQGWARLYQYGSAFWGADPAAAVYYFSQVAAAAPYLHDGTGWTAMARYRAVLIQYGDTLADQDEWCAAEEQYRLAANINNNPELDDKIDHAAYECSPPTATPTITPTFTLTPTATATGTLPPTWTPSPTTAAPPTVTLTPTPTETVTQPTPPTEAPATPTETPTSPPATTEPPTVEPTATSTATTPPPDTLTPTPTEQPPPDGQPTVTSTSENALNPPQETKVKPVPTKKKP